MATLYFQVSSDWEEVVRLRQECERLEAQLKKMDSRTAPAATKALETQLASTRQQMMGLVTEAAKAGAVMENDLKRKIESATKVSDELSEEIIKQRKIIRETQEDVRQLSEQYSKMGKYSPQSASTLNQLNKTKAALNEQRYALGELQDQQARNRLEVRQLTREYKEFSQGTDKATVIVDALMSSLKRTAAEIGGLAAIKKFGSDVIDATGKMQQLQVALSTILQDKNKADQLISEIVQFAAKTPFNLDDVATGAKQLLAYGSSAEKVVEELSMLGDVASGLQIPIGQLIYLYGTLRTQGRAMTVDIRQFAGRGIPIYEELAKVLGVAKDQVGALVTEGKVGFAEVEQAFKNMTSEGGKFNNLMENSAGTWPQRLSNIQDTLFQKLNDFGNKYKEVFEFGIGTAEDLVASLDDVISVIGSLIAAYGTYKATLIAIAAIQKASGFIESIRLIAMYRKELGLATAAQQAFNVAAKSNVYVTLLSVLVGVGTAVYMFTKRTNEATAAQKALNSVNKKADEEFSKQAATIDRLTGVLKSETSSLDQKKKALNELQAIVPSYNASLSEEGKLINSNTEAIKAYLTQLEKQIRMKATQEELEESLKNKRDLEKEERKLSDEYWNIRQTNTLQGYNRNSFVAKASRMFGAEKEDELRKKLEDIRIKIKENDAIILGLNREIEQGELSRNKNISQSNISKELETVTNKIKTLKQEIADIRSGKVQVEAGKTVESVIKAKEKELKSANETLETLTGSKPQTTKQENTISQQKDRISELERKNATDRIRQQEDLENKVAQSRIDAMDEGFEKEKAQMELNHKKELQGIGRQRQDYVNAIVQMEKEAFDAKEKLKASNDKNYKPKAFDSSTVSVDTSAFDIMGKEARERQKMEIADFYKDSLSEYQDYITKYNSTREKFAKDRDRYKKAGASDTQLKEIDYQEQEALKAIDNEFAAREESFNSWADSVIDLSIEKLRELLNQAYQEMMNMEISDPNNPDLAVKRAKVATLRNALEKKEIEKEVSPGKSIKDWDKLYKVLTDVNDVFEEIGDTVGGTFGEIISLAGGIASSSLQAVGAIKGIGEAASGLEKASGILAAISAGMKIISGIGGFFKEKFGADYSEYDALKSQYETLIGIWDQLIGKKMEYIDIDYGIEAQKAADEAAKLVNVQIERQRQLIKQLASSGSSAGSHSLGYRINDRLTAEDYERISGLVGEKITAEYQLWDLSSEQMEKLLTDERLVSVLGEVNGEFIEYIQNIADYGNQLEEIAQKEKEALTGIGFDEFKSGYVDLLSDLDSTNEEFADNFEKYLQNAIFSSLIANKYKDEIESLYDQWAADSESGGRLTPEEAERLRQEQKELTEQMLADREQLMNDFGWEPSGGTSAQQASSAVKVQASQESVDETNGRLTAIQETGYRIENVNQQQAIAITELKGSISGLLSKIGGMYNISDETRTILANSYLELQQIRENTGEIVKPIKQMQKDIEEVKRNTSRL
ncbi:tape measure protein [Paraprevotella clara]|uniref:tape measure protein n=1 Tax=Paraprevotella clara TaxID=454154 RepID=UPI003AB34381